MPHSTDLEYAQRAIPQYERAVELAGGLPVRIPLDQTPGELKTMIASCAGVLLPGSKADVDPAKFRQAACPSSAAADMRREPASERLAGAGFTQLGGIRLIGIDRDGIFRADRRFRRQFTGRFEGTRQLARFDFTCFYIGLIERIDAK